MQEPHDSAHDSVMCNSIYIRMKKCMLLLFFVSVFGLSCIAQESELPLVEEGRTWHTVSLHPAVPLAMVPVPLDKVNDYIENLVNEGSCVSFPHGYVIKGDTLINGHTYKKLSQTDTSDRYLAALRQENDCVYAVDKNETSEYVLFDFGLKVGDVVKNHVGGLDMMRVDHVDTVLVNDKECRRLYMWAYQEGVEIVNGLVDIWIEGLGCMSGPFFTFQWTATGSSSLLLDCYQNNSQLVITEKSTMDYNPMVLSVDQTTKFALFDLQGRRLTDKPASGVYIENGKKVVVK